MAHLGIDVSKRDLRVALLRTDGKFRSRKFANDAEAHRQLLDWLEAKAGEPVHACLEATGDYGEAAAEALYDAGHTVSVVNPGRIKAFAESEGVRSKTDAVDAKLIARFCAAMAPVEWTPLASELRPLRALVRRLDALKRMRVQESNRLDTAHESVQDDLVRHIAYLDRQIEATEQAIRDHIDNDPDLRDKANLLTSIPGLSDTTVAWLLGEVRFELYASARQLAAHSGLTPAHRESGTSVRGKPRISRRGNRRLRQALYMPALTGMRCNPVLKAFAQRLRQRGKHGKAIVAAVMRKLLHIAFGVLRHQRPFNPQRA